MNEPGGKAPEQRDTRPRILATIGAAAAILIPGAGAAYFLTRASPEALAVAWWAVITMGLVGLIVMIYVVAAHQSVPGSGYDGGDDPPPTSGPGSAPLMDHIDAELFRILADARLGDISTRRARGTGAA
jgi:hypothetical protein